MKKVLLMTLAAVALIVSSCSKTAEDPTVAHYVELVKQMEDMTKAGDATAEEILNVSGEIINASLTLNAISISELPKGDVVILLEASERVKAIEEDWQALVDKHADEIQALLPDLEEDYESFEEMWEE